MPLVTHILFLASKALALLAIKVLALQAIGIALSVFLSVPLSRINTLVHVQRTTLSCTCSATTFNTIVDRSRLVGSLKNTLGGGQSLAQRGLAALRVWHTVCRGSHDSCEARGLRRGVMRSAIRHPKRTYACTESR